MKRNFIISLLLGTGLAVCAGAAELDNFESYNIGSNLHGQDGWTGWDNSAAAGAVVSDAFAYSGTRSVRVTGGSDLVRTFSGISTGLWTFRIKQYVPSSSTGTNYVILLNQYRDGPGSSLYNWSIQTQNQLDAGLVFSEYGGGVANLVKDAWAEFRFEIDLDAGTVTEYYNDQMLGFHTWHGDEGVNVLRALDLFANNAGPVYYDDLAVTPPPLTGADLQLRAVMELYTDAGLPASSMYNPRYFDTDLYVAQINPSAMGIGRYRSGSPTPALAINNSAALEHRMVAPFRGADKSKYLIAGGGAPANTSFSRYDYDGSNRVDVVTPFNMMTEGFDWVDADTIITTIYTSGSRTRLYLLDVVADPFALTLNTTWNANGYVTTGAGTRIRNVRAGDVYSGYAYYGDAGQNTEPRFFALNLATGEEKPLGNAGFLTGSGSFGLWTVVERGGLLYVQTTDNGIQIYRMTSATTLGPLYAMYTKEEVDLATGYAGQYYGFDVAPGGATFALAASQGKVFEFGSPLLNIAANQGTDLTLSWPTVVNGFVVQSSATLSPANFTDVDPQPPVVVDGKFNKVSVPLGASQGYFRLRKGP